MYTHIVNIIHPHQKEGLKVLKGYSKELIISSAAWRGDTEDVDRHHRTKVLPRVQVRDQGTRHRLNTVGYAIRIIWPYRRK